MSKKNQKLLLGANFHFFLCQVYPDKINSTKSNTKMSIYSGNFKVKSSPKFYFEA